MKFRGSLISIYGDAFCAGYRDRDHVFGQSGDYYSLCECGDKKRIEHSCSDCDDRHMKIVDSTEAERVSHELLRLHYKIDALTSQSAVRRDTHSPEMINLQ